MLHLVLFAQVGLFPVSIFALFTHLPISNRISNHFHSIFYLKFCLKQMIFILLFTFLTLSGDHDGIDREWTEMGRQWTTKSTTLMGWKLLTVRSSPIRNKTGLILDHRTDVSKHLGGRLTRVTNLVPRYLGVKSLGLNSWD